MPQCITDFRLQPEDFGTFGHDLARPECVWIDTDGVWTSDARGGVSRVHADRPAATIGSGIHEPNGFSRRRDGSFVVAGLGDGKVHLIRQDGQTSVLLDAVDGKSLGAVNCAWADGERTWISVMTDSLPWSVSMNQEARGYIILLDGNGARVVADGLHQTNEVKVSADGRYLYAVETLGRHLVRFEIGAHGVLGRKEIVGPADLGHGAYPDGFAFDAEGNIWLTLIIRNGLAVITKEGNYHVVYEEPKTAAIDNLVNAISARAADVNTMRACIGERLPFPTSIAFGGNDGRTAYVGSLATPHIFTFRSPVAGERRSFDG
jgi:gluconolactonase